MYVQFYLYLCRVFSIRLALNPAMRTYYRVADHIFAVEYTNAILPSLLTNYEPFLADIDLPNEAIFVLRIEQSNLLSEQQRTAYKHIFTDQSEEDMPRIEVYQTQQKDYWLMRISQFANFPICCELECNSHFTEGVVRVTPDYPDIRFCIDNALMLIYAFRTAPLMTLEMHAAVVVKGDLGHLFLGHSGTGKSTHARQWLQAFPDAWLLNDDNPILRVMSDGEVRVYGSPWSGKTPCYVSNHAPVGGIIKLSQAPHNKIRSASLPEAYAYILSSASGLKMDQYIADNMYKTIKHIVTHITCYHLECLPNTDAAKVCLEGM